MSNNSASSSSIKPTSILTLPGELRNTIYALVFLIGNHERFHRGTMRNSGKPWGKLSPDTKANVVGAPITIIWPYTEGLLVASRQIRDEALSLIKGAPNT